MAKIISIDTGTRNPGVSEIDDIVSVHDDDVVLGPAYSTFKITEVVGLTAKEVRKELHADTPKVKPVFRAAKADTWSLEHPEQGEAWQNVDGKWYLFEKMPKHIHSLAGVPTGGLSAGTTRAEKKEILRGIKQNLKTEPLVKNLIPEA